MQHNVVNWFEIPVSDMARAKKFYSGILDKELTDLSMEGTEMAAFPWVQEGAFASGALVKMEGYVPSANGSIVYFYCEDLSVELGRVEEFGGKIIIPKTSIGEHGFFAQFIDSEGNRVAFHSMK